MPVQQGHNAKPKVCVFLLHHGSPERSPKLPAYLHNVLMDALPLPKLIRSHAAGLMARMHAPKVRAQLQQLTHTIAPGQDAVALARALQTELTERGYGAHVFLANRHATPTVRDALLDARAHAADAQWLVLPLFPQYAADTTGLCLAALYARLSPAERQRTHMVDSYPSDARVLDTMAACVNTTLAHLAPEARREVHMVFAARSISAQNSDAGDPYLRQVEQTVSGLLTRIQNAPRHTLAFHRSAPAPTMPWARHTEPSLHDTLVHLGAAGQKNVVVVPISAVAEDFQTLHELDVAMGHVAQAAGIRGYYRVPTVSASDGFVEALAEMVQAYVPGTHEHRAEEVTEATIQTRPGVDSSVSAVP